MTNLGIVGIVNFNEWDNPAYKETGGINSVVKTIIPHLKADRIILIGFTDKRETLFHEKKVAKGISIVPIVCVPEGSIFPRRVLCFLFGWRIFKYIRKYKINIVYNHAEEFGFWLSLKKIPFIHHLHTFVNVLEISDNKLARFPLFHILWEKMRIYVIKHSRKIVAVNKDIVDMCRELIGDARIIECPNYIDTAKFVAQVSSDHRERYALDGCKVALFIGRISKIKGLELMVDALSELRRLGRHNWRGLVVGNGENEATLREYIDKKGLTGEIIFAGSVNNPAEVAKFYSLADVFLITSFSESVPLTLLESLSCGTPVVSTNVGIASDVLTGENGFVVETRDAAEFAEKMELSLSFKSERSLLFNEFKYSVRYASELLNKELEGAK